MFKMFDGDKLRNKVTGIKQVSDKENQTKLTMENYELEKKYRGHRATGDKIPPDKKLLKIKKELSMNRKYQDVNKNEAKFLRKIAVVK